MPFAMCCVGQGGNQIGAATLRYTGPPLVASLATGGKKPASACVFVDSEPKVIRTFATEGAPSYMPFIDPWAVVAEHSGRGNNWAWGYSGGVARASKGALPSASKKSEPLWSRATLALRKQAEACDSSGGLEGVLVYHSLGGGTGSGLGSRILESIRDDFPKTCIVSACVAPFRSGDTPLQHYNMVLTLATAQACADGILYFDNDDLLSRSKVRRRHAAAFGPSAAASTGSASAARASVRAERSGKGDELRISTGDMNDVAAQALAGVLLPVATRKRLPRGAREVRGRGEGEASGRPGWVDTRVSSNKAAAEAGAWAPPEEEEGKGGGRGSWIDASVRGIPAAYGGGGGGDDEDMEGYDEGLGSIVNSFDPRSFVQELVPAPARKFIDIRTVVNAFPDECGKGGGGVGAMHLPAGYHSYVSPALTWMELADNLSDVVPRFDKDGRPVVCTAARLYARGVTQTEADSVDPTLPGSSASGGGGSSIDPRARSTLSGRLPLGSSRSTAQLWQGLPSTEEWMVVGSKLQRMYPPLPGSTHLRSAVLSPPPLTRCSLSPLPVKPDLRMLTTAANTDWMVPNLISCVERTDELLHVGAYVHWYERFGVERGHIQAAAEAVLDAADAYMDARGGSGGGGGGRGGGSGGTQAPRR